jgi:calmodulin
LFDSDQSGEINASELKSLTDKLGLDLDDVDLNELLAKLDSNGNGTIAFNEFAEQMGQCFYKKPTKSDVEAAFKVFDKDTDGFINAEELYRVMKQFRGNLKRSQIDQMIDQLDKDSDDKISINGNFIFVYS